MATLGAIRRAWAGQRPLHSNTGDQSIVAQIETRDKRRKKLTDSISEAQRRGYGIRVASSEHPDPKDDGRRPS